MKRAILTLLVMCAALAAHAANLRWVNGEAMDGDLLEASGTTVTWQSPLFESPLILGWPAVRRIDWKTEDAAVADPFLISLRDGSSIHGDIVSITGSSVFIHGSRYGDVELKRSEILNARRVKGGALIWAGPTGDAGWKSAADENGGARDAAVGPGGSLDLPYWNRSFGLFLPLPDSIDIEFHVHSSVRPNFDFIVGDQHGTELRIGTWDDEIVARVGHDFKLIRKMQDTERSEALRFTWDWKTRRCAVFTPGGDLLADWQAPEDQSSAKPGVLLCNKGRNLSLDFLRIRAGNGNPPKYDATRPRVEKDDGSIVDGAILTGSAGVIQLNATTVALKDADAIYFSADELAVKSAEASLTFADGTYLLGNLDSVKNGAATVSANFSAQPLTTGTDALRHLRINVPDTAVQTPFSKLDLLTIQNATFHGKIASGSGDGPQWLPIGAMASSAPLKTMPYEITRNFPDDSPAPTATALFYTRTGDILPGVLRAMDRDGVEFDSGITEQGRLRASELVAIQFDAKGRMNLQGFSDPGWRIVSGDETKVVRNGDYLMIDSGCSIGHPGAMQAREIRFTVDNRVFAAMRLRMFCAGTDPSKSANMLVVTTGGQVLCGMEASPGQFDEPRIQVNSPSGSVAVRFVIEPNDIVLYLNGACMQKFPVPAAGRHGAGLVIDTAGIWGNNSRSVSLSHFSTISQPGATWMPDVAADTKAQALTVPRAHRDNPPRHALIAANGDVLRGEIEAATATNFGFRTGVEELTVPRDRVKAVIWLGKPVESGSAATPLPASTVLPRLQGMLTNRVIFGNTNFENAIRFIQSEVPDLKFTYPKTTLNHNGMLRIGGEPIADALGRICAAFGYQYRVDDTGVIVIEPEGAAAPVLMAEKVYWMKAGSFPNDAAADKALAAKGIPFPAGASAAWNADAGQLNVRNTPENLARIAKVLASDFGGSLGSPTHWLLLTSGARIALVVDKCDKDVITGHHPIYGRCTIPVADVVSFRSYPMDASPVMKSLDGWRLVYAPEPVLPESGGDSSALVGKVAPPFKLNLVAGGQFDLAQQKGKVVVLDFWATWCGPCVHSLPGLIQSMSGFTQDRVAFVAVNQDEPGPHVKQFIDSRGWKVSVALDDGGHVGQQYGADAIPHTVIIRPDGKIAWVKTGSSPGGEEEAAKEVNQLLAAPAPQ